MNKITDEQLIIDAREGDERAFRELVNRYESRVAATVMGMLGYCSEAEDVGQETFIRFYRALSDFRGESSVGTYLTRIAINLSLNELRRRKRKTRLFTDTDAGEMPAVRDERAERIAFEDREAVHRVLQSLKPEYRSVIVLRLLDGYSTEETAGILDIPLGTVLSRLSRAQRLMREIWTREFGDWPWKRKS